MSQISYLFRCLLPFLLIFLLLACKEQPEPKKTEETKPSYVRIDRLLQEKSTKLQGGLPIHFTNPEDSKKLGWESNSNFLRAVRKRTILEIPEPPLKDTNTFLMFRARLPANVPSQTVTIHSGKRQFFFMDLTNGWKEYQAALPPGAKKIRFVFEGKNKTGSFGDFTDFQLQFYGHTSFKVGNEVRSSIILPANTSLSFLLTVPTGNPFLSLGVAVQGDNQEIPLSVMLKEDSLTKTQELPASSKEWRDHQIDLSAFAGKQVHLELKSTGKARSSRPDTWFAAWSNPEIVDLSAKREGPNIILFSIDAIRWDHLSHYGYSIKTSPNLDMLAQRSTVFKNAYCTSPSTLPSHASLMTGLYVGQHHVGRKTRGIRRLERIPERFLTLAELASQKNYRTAAITDDGYVSSFYGFQQGFQQYFDNNDVEKNEIVQTIDDGILWLKKNQSRPFFLFLHSYEVHEPFTPPLSAFQHLFPNHKLKGGKSPEIHNEWLKDVMTGKKVPTAEEKELVRKAFDAEIYFFDQQFGRLLKELQNLRLNQNTILIIFSDHGQQFFERGNSFGHASSLLPEEIRIPLILYLPGKAPQERKEIVSLVDVYPTVASLIGVKNPPQVDGLNLMQASNKQLQNRSIYYEINFGEKVLWGMQNHEYKLLVDSSTGLEYLFDLRKDPEEAKNLIGLSPRALKPMKELLSAYIAKSIAEPKFRDKEPDVEEAKELNERLRALGYLN